MFTYNFSVSSGGTRGVILNYLECFDHQLHLLTSLDSITLGGQHYIMSHWTLCYLSSILQSCTYISLEYLQIFISLLKIIIIFGNIYL